MSNLEARDPEETSSYCDPQIIPIFPLRFALKGETLINMLSSNTTPSAPQTLNNPQDHELLRIRQGYLYIYDGELFQIFRFNTQHGDENGSIYRTDTELAPNATAYMFTKYEFSDGTPQSEWRLIQSESYPYAFVPKDTPKAWVAYSEERWPDQFFGEIPKDAVLRNALMTEVDLASRTGPFCAPITELSEHVKAFTEGPVQYSEADYTLENAIRLTAVEIEPVSKVVTCNNTREKGVMVGLHDPVGEIQDLLGLMTVHAFTLSNFAQEHQYPIIMGGGVKNYAEKEEVSTRWISFAGDFGWNKGALSQEFESKYDSLMQQMADLETAQKKLTEHWLRLITRTGFGTMDSLINACTTITGRYSLENNPVDHSNAVAFLLYLLARSSSASAVTKMMSGIQASLFSEESGEQPPDRLAEATEYFKRAMDQSKNILTGAQKMHAQFKPALNAVFTVYGTQIVQAGVAGNNSATNRLIGVMFDQRPIRLRNVDELQSAFSDMMDSVGLDGADISFQAQQLGNNITANMLLNEAAEGRVGVIEFHAQVDLTVDDSYLRHARSANNFDLGINGFGLVAAGLSLYQSINNLGKPVRADSSVGRFALDPRTQLIVAFAAAYEASFEVGKAIAGRSNNAATATVLRNVFGNNAALANSAAANGASAVSASRAIALKSLSYSAKAAGMVGVVVSGFMAVEGFEREDKSMMVGNGLMAVGGLVLLLGAAGPLAIVAVAAIVIGAVIAYFSYDDAQQWVQRGFWGTFSEYWEEERPKLIEVQIDDAKALANTEHTDYNRIKRFFEQELEQYLDINATLAINEDSLDDGDGIVEILSSALQSPADINRLSVKAYVDWTFPYPNLHVRTSITYIATGKARAVLTKPSSLNENGPVEIEVALSRNEYAPLETSTTIQSNRLW